MLPKKQKTILLFLTLLSMIIDLLVIIPFRTFGESYARLEVLYKFVGAPAAVILFSLYANVLKYRKSPAAKGSSRIVAVCAYLPVFSYMINILVFGAYLLTRGAVDFNLSLYSLILSGIIALATFLLIAGYHFPKAQSAYRGGKRAFLDVLILLAANVAAGAIYYLNEKYQGVELKPDLILLALYACVLVSLFVKINFYRHVFREDATYKVLELPVQKDLPEQSSGEQDSPDKKEEFSQVVTVTENKDHLLRKKQKTWLYAFSVFSLFLCFLGIFPFKAIFGWYQFELYFKYIALPFVLLLTVLYAFILKYRDDGSKSGYSQAIAVNSYFPMFIYLISICSYGIYLLVIGGTVNLGLNAWGGLIAFYVIVLLVSLFLSVFFPRVQITLKKGEHVIADLALVVIFICINAITGILFTTFNYVELQLDYSIFILFLIFVLYTSAALGYIIKINRKEYLYLEVPLTNPLNLIPVDEEEKPEEKKEIIIERVVEKTVEVKRELTAEELQAIHEEEYKRAFQDALARLDAEIEPKPAEPTKKAKKEIKEVPQSIEVHHADLDDASSLVNPSKAQDEEDNDVEEENDNEKGPARIIEPSFLDIIKYTGSMPDVTYVANETQTNYKFIYDNKMFLLTVNTNSGYNIFFLAELDEVMNMIVKYPNITKAKTPKGENWFRLTNKGDFPEDVIYDIIEHSLEMLHVLEERKLEEKERIKELKHQAKEAERLKIKEAQKALKEKEKLKAKKAASKSTAKKTTTTKKTDEE